VRTRFSAVREGFVSKQVPGKQDSENERLSDKRAVKAEWTLLSIYDGF
jgi:hypothetical protein